MIINATDNLIQRHGRQQSVAPLSAGGCVWYQLRATYSVMKRLELTSTGLVRAQDLGLATAAWFAFVPLDLSCNLNDVKYLFIEQEGHYFRQMNHSYEYCRDRYCFCVYQYCLWGCFEVASGYLLKLKASEIWWLSNVTKVKLFGLLERYIDILTCGMSATFPSPLKVHPWYPHMRFPVPASILPSLRGTNLNKEIVNGCCNADCPSHLEWFTMQKVVVVKAAFLVDNTWWSKQAH